METVLVLANICLVLVTGAYVWLTRRMATASESAAKAAERAAEASERAARVAEAALPVGFEVAALLHEYPGSEFETISGEIYSTPSKFAWIGIFIRSTESNVFVHKLNVLDAPPLPADAISKIRAVSDLEFIQDRVAGDDGISPVRTLKGEETWWPLKDPESLGSRRNLDHLEVGIQYSIQGDSDLMWRSVVWDRSKTRIEMTPRHS